MDKSLATLAGATLPGALVLIDSERDQIHSGEAETGSPLAA